MRHGTWIVGAWLLVIAQGAATTSVLRAPLGRWFNVAPWAFNSHWALGAAVGALAVVFLLRSREPRRELAVLLVAATIAFGWLATRGLDPRMAFGHAALAPIAALSVFSVSMRRTATASISARHEAVSRWAVWFVRSAVILLMAQIALGAALRHQLIGLEWHLLGAGLVAAAVLVPAVTMVNNPDTPVHRRRAARGAIIAVVLQISLGAMVLMMLLVGPPSLKTWLVTGVAHVTVGTLALLATAALARAFASEPHVGS
jgi:heme A synthase